MKNPFEGPYAEEFIQDMMPAFSDITVERLKQHSKWGKQDFADGTRKPGSVDDANYAKAQCDEAMKGRYVDWEMILREEFFEAMAETDPAKLRAELVQLAAVAVQWIQAIDRRKG